MLFYADYVVFKRLLHGVNDTITMVLCSKKHVWYF
jgi:hypothetical protein